MLGALRRFINQIPDPSAARLTLVEELQRQLSVLKPGVTLDVGGGRAPYRDLVPHTKYLTLDVDPTKHPDICCDLHHVAWESNYFDTILATEVLEHLYDPQQAVREMLRLLKDDGVCVLSTRFIHPIHGVPNDYFRFTADGLRHLFADFHDVQVIPLGNRLLAVWLLATHTRLPRKLKRLQLPLMPFTRLISKVKVNHTRMPLGYLVVARKAAAGALHHVPHREPSAEPLPPQPETRNASV